MATRSTHGEEGLTVLGLGVIVVAVVVLVGVATVGLGARRSAGDENAKREAEAAATASSMHAAETGKVPTAAELAAYEPSLEYESLEPGEEVAVQGKVYVRSHGNVAELAARSGETCFWVQRTATTTRYAKSACDVDPSALTFRASW